MGLDASGIMVTRMFAESLVALVSLLSLQAARTSDMPAVLAGSLPVARYAQPPIVTPIKKKSESLGMVVRARAAVVLDESSGNILFDKDAHTPYPIASLTKIVAAMAFLDSHPSMDEEIVLTRADEAGEGREVFFTGERLTKREALQALLVGSVNEAGSVLARTSSGGTEGFVEEMNKKAEAIGLEQAHFYDSTGLDRRNRATAHDVALALRAALAYPEIQAMTEIDRIEIKSRIGQKPYVIKSTNLLLGSFLNRDPYRVIAAKTGSLPEAGYCLAQVTEHGSHRIIVVVLGSPNHFDRFQDAKALTYWAFDTFEWPKLSLGTWRRP